MEQTDESCSYHAGYGGGSCVAAILDTRVMTDVVEIAGQVGQGTVGLECLAARSVDHVTLR